MKKTVILILCVLFVSAPCVYAASYKVSGTVYQQNTTTRVGGASVRLECTWVDANCNGFRLGSSSTLGTNYGDYTLSWANCGTIDTNPAYCKNSNSCKDRSMFAIASKIIGMAQYSGGKSWTAGSSPESKNLRIYPCIRSDIVVTAQPAKFEGEPAWPQVQPVPVYAFDNDGGDPTPVTQYNMTFTYDDSKMLCTDVEPVSGGEFVLGPYNTSIPGTVTVQCNSLNPNGVPLGSIEEPTQLFILRWTVPEPETADYTYVITEPTSEITIFGEVDPNNPVYQESEFKIGEPNGSPYFRIADVNDWNDALLNDLIKPLEQWQWDDYMSQWQLYTEDGNEYPDTNFMPPFLYVYEGSESNPDEPNDAGLVMTWGDGNDGDFASAWQYQYKKDPDLSNCTINLVVTAPKIGTNGQINQVSFGLQNPPAAGGPIRSWYWNCGAKGSGAPIIWGVPTRITIDTSKTGRTAATPTATAYMNNPGFNLKVVQWILLDENGTWVGSNNPAPAPGGAPSFLWNYWHWIMISPNTTLSKDYYKKWSQAAVVIGNEDPPFIQGWDEYSEYYNPPMVADDWKCADDRPITDLHWWGSFIGWNNPDPPPILPQAFHIGIWSDVPDPDVNDANTFSHPGTLIWEHVCDNYVMNFAGYDVDPRAQDPDPNVPIEPEETCFQFNQLLDQEGWFYQEHDPCEPNGTIYWLSIAAIWDPCQPEPTYDWGWKTRSHNFNDDAAIIQTTFDGTWPPTVGSMWGTGVPIQHPPYPDPDSITFDMAFELSTNEPSPNDDPASPDLNFDGLVDLTDLAILANKWMDTVQY